MKKSLVVILFLCVSLVSLARPFRGRVVDESGTPLSYVSVYLKSNPSIGGATDNEGLFSVDISLASEKGEEIVFSFIGFRTEERWLREISDDGTTVITLVEQPIMLQGATIQAKLSRKESKRLRQEALKRFSAQVHRDFPPRKTIYSVVSSYSGSQDSRQIIYHEVVGTLTEHNAKSRHGKSDSVSLDVSKVKNNYSVVVEPTYRRFNELTAEQIAREEAKNKKKGVGNIYTPRDLDDQTLRMHRFFWGGYTASIFQFADTTSISSWDYTLIEDRPVLVFTMKRNLLGIAKLSVVQHFYVHPSSYAIERIAQSVDVELHIPFGYKLDEDQLELLNLLQFDNRKYDKYRLRHAYVNVQRNVFFHVVDGNRVVREKNISVKGTAIDTRKQKLNYSAKSKIIVTAKPSVVK